MPQGSRTDYQEDRGGRDRRAESRQREQDHDLELDRQRKYDGTFRPEDPNYHRERIARGERNWGGAPSYNAEYPYSGQGQGEPYGEGFRRGRDQHHDNYLRWRGDYIRKLDDEYEAYRAEHQSKFDDDFDSWRSRNSKLRSDNPTAGGLEAEQAKKRNH